MLGARASDNHVQATAITGMTAPVGTMDKGTQRNAAMFEETSAAAQSLNIEVERLAPFTTAFRTGDNRAVSTAALAEVNRLPPAALAALRRPELQGLRGGN
jgi:methyl-accepting chemotaxis protein